MSLSLCTTAQPSKVLKIQVSSQKTRPVQTCGVANFGGRPRAHAMRWKLLRFDQSTEKLTKRDANCETLI